MEISNKAGADSVVKRPKNLATDKAAKLPAIQHCLLNVEKNLNLTFDIVIDLDATSPLRNKDDIIGALNLLECSSKKTNVITGSNARRSPYFNLVEIDVNGLVHLSGIKKQWREMVVLTSDSIRKAINVINTKGQIVFVVDKDDKLKGTITDRDIRKTIVNDIKVDDNEQL